MSTARVGVDSLEASCPSDKIGSISGRTNKLLRRIPDIELGLISSIADEVELKPRQVLHHWRLPMEHVYFVVSGLISVSAKVDNTRFVEAWLIGSEGMVGAPYVLAPDDCSPAHRRVVQVPGAAIRIPAASFVAALEHLPVLRELILRYINLVLFQTSQCGACNSLHSVKQRLARWLLMAMSALESVELPLTHAVLGQLLGIRRASVSECLEAFQRKGMIQNDRAAVRIINKAALEQTACPCFTLIQREYDRQLGHFGIAPSDVPQGK